MSALTKLKYRPRKMILKGKYYCPIVPEYGHYENEGLWGYDKLVYVDRNRYKTVKCLFKTEEERDEAYKKDYNSLRELGKLMLKRKGRYYKEEIDNLEIECCETKDAFKVIEGRTIRVIF